ncbi:MAG: bifunctional transaldolase/phosoglucose isomerase, partial [Nitrospinota bacterium]
MQNPLVAIQQFGQSIWYDYISRHLLTSGELQRLITQDGIRGVTSNPAIFEKAITSSTDYDDTLVTLLQERDRDAHSLYEHLAIQDIQMAADLMAPVYQQTNRRDGYVCLEVSPHLADDTTATIEEARRLWRTIARPNAMIKVPATPAGLPAIQQLISEGINVNVTLLFSISMYEAVANAYINGIEALIAHGGDPRRVASVASFFVSRIDTAVDQRITARLQQVTSPEEKNLLTSLLGQAAVASARLAYQKYTTLYHTPRWQALAAQGAQTQRLLWASTSTKNPDYSDVKYVEELIGPETINTIPTATLEAFRDHGHPQARLTTRLEEAGQIMERLEQAGISMQEVTDTLLVQGVRLFADAFDQLLGAIEQKRRALLGAKLNGQSFSLPADFQASVDTLLEEWRTRGKVRKLWARDASLWTGTDENHWLGWLDVVTEQGHRIDHLQKIGEEVKREGFSHALLLGMGGSSLCPEVLSLTFGPQPGYPVLRVLDSTDPDQIERIEQGIDLTKTLFIVSSKSGTTLETSLLERYFFARVQEKVGPERAGKQFIAITDPGSPLQKRAEEKGFRAVYPGRPDIGGRYSALSDFGMVPAALMGMDVSRLLSATEHMIHSCAAAVPPATNPG